MSFKAKDLSYEAKEPAFLRRLRGEVAGSGDSDRHERQIARPKRLKKDDEEDDGPTYVIEESGDTVSKADYEAMLAKDEEGPDADETSKGPDGEAADAKEKSKQQVAEAGQGMKKRKVGKVIGTAEEDDGSPGDDKKEPAKKMAKKPRKKTKIKLSFEDE
ncbi:hypothetical protein NA57DRAFT_72451 [Rhizodiscina lignyota]|uniref:DUF4604 domain-containing protein n=1 Tax=Rhizodiscina lignyota TaxID=1504668 RepID=A0A9P4IL03_9PEZI|nr:hypothetical protein NA57DRAFT_72451 [Rhizodiscina lignyota]